MLPVTFHIKQGLQDPKFEKFKEYYMQRMQKMSYRHNVWVAKPGENSNRGCGIKVVQEFNEICALIN